MSWVRRIRILYQAVFLILFVWLLERLIRGDLHNLPYAIFHQTDPLSMIALSFAAGVIPGAMIWGLVLILMTLVFGRVFCGWICPLGTLQQLSAWLLAPRSRRESLRVNRYRRWYATKYIILVVLLVLALAGSLQTGLLDPLSVLARGIGAAVWPALPGGRPMPGGWLAAGFLFGILLASRWIPRLFCRAFCPLGALLGFFARFSLLRIHRDATSCTNCQLCTVACQGADEPLGEHRISECMVCLNCTVSCPEQAIGYNFLPPAPPRPATPDLSRRWLIGSAISALVAAPIIEATGGGRASARAELIRPPGALPEPQFLERCVKCSLCQQACPTGAIQPAIFQAGVEGFWTPVIVPRRGWCEYTCTRCGEVCPTQAITRLTPARKTGTDGQPPVRIGTAFIDRGRCLPWGMETPCIVCEEMCPTDPKAIWLEPVTVRRQDGKTVHLQRPHVDPARCVGCGICENRCPAGAHAAICVSSVGESRDPLNNLLLPRIPPAARKEPLT